MTFRPRTTTIPLGAAALLVWLAAACASPSGPAAAELDVRGAWAYTASQGAPPATLVGTLTFEQQRGGDFSGRLDVREIDAAGVQRERAGGTTGRAVDGATLDFDAFLTPSPRRHVGRITGDTMSGTWVEPATNGVLTGAFRAVRMGPS
jgi:hypothetical protein